MDPTPEPPQPEDPASADVVEEITLGRKISWIALMVVLVMPLVWLAAFFVSILARNWLPSSYEGPGMPGLLLVGAATVTFALGRAGLRRGWASRKVLLGGWSLLVLSLLTLLFVIPPHVRLSSQDKAVMSNLRQIEAAAEQFYLDNGGYFVTYDDLVGPTRFLKGIPSIEGEDYHPLFPIRHDHVEELRVTKPDGRVVSLYPPHDVPDGVHEEEIEGLRFETMYHRGWPDGPARVLEKGGRVVSTANYVEGHIVGPCLDRGRDLNAPGNRPPDATGREKLAARDFVHAELDFTRAIAQGPSYLDWVGRAEARLALGNLDGAIADYEVATKFHGQLYDPDSAGLLSAFSQRSVRRKAEGNATGAAADELAVARLHLPELYKEVDGRLKAGDYAGAAALYTRIIGIRPGDTDYNNRSLARYELGDLDGALADLDEAIRLSRSRPWPIVFLKRAWLYRLKNNLPGAAADFRAVAGAQPKDLNYRSESCHAACWLFLVECARGEDQAATEELARTAAQVDLLGPTTGVRYRLEADLLLGRITEEQLMAKVATPAGEAGEANRFQALFFAGMLHQRTGDTAGALDRFRRALQTTYAHQFVPDVLEARRAVASAGPAGK